MFLICLLLSLIQTSKGAVDYPRIVSDDMSIEKIANFLSSYHKYMFLLCCVVLVRM